ncbi:MAG: methyltransferase domain-containing protein [Gammaproteobacteria bacterium]|nr:methyltransferase domain-containing protein [Gammaproteobacteria bacterium]
MPQPTGFDHSSDPSFFDYYARESLSAGTVQRFERVRDRALALLARRGRHGPFSVLDIGCGAGTQAMLWAGLGHQVAAIDVNEPLVVLGRRRAAERSLPIRFDVGSATALPYDSASIDVALLPELLEHVAEWEACLGEAVRTLRPGGLLYLSTTSWLCPRQEEFTLPGYSWYPGPVKRWCVRRSLTTHPQWANHARYPAVNWFSYYGLSRWLRARGFQTLDRFDVLAQQPLGGLQATVVGAIRALPPARLLAHMATAGTTVWALRD